MSENILWAGEAQLIGYGESDSSGAWLKIRVEVDDLAKFRGLKGQVFPVAFGMCEGGDGTPPKEEADKPKKGKYGESASKLHSSGFLGAVPVARALGTDKEFQDFVRSKPCMVSGSEEEPRDYCHVRRANNSGTGIKPDFYGVPMLHRFHFMQHQFGELHVYNEAMRRLNHHTSDVNEAKEWFDKAAFSHRKEWVTKKLKALFGVDSMTKISPKDIIEWAHKNDVYVYLPRNDGNTFL